MTSTLPRETPLLVRLLLEHGDLEPADLDRLGVPVEALPALPVNELIEAGLADESVLAMRLAEYVGCSWFQLADPAAGSEEVEEGFAPGDLRPRGPLPHLIASLDGVLDRVPESVFRNRGVLPLFLAHGTFHLIASDPLDQGAVEEIRMMLGMPVAQHACTVSLFRRVRLAVFGERDKISEALGGDGSRGGVSLVRPDHDVDLDLTQPLPGGQEGRVLRLVNSIVLQALEEGASDVHCEPYESKVRIRYRVDGKLREAASPPPDAFAQAVSRIKILAKMDIAEKRKPQDGAISVSDGDRRVDLRVSTVPTVYGEKVVMRVLEKEGLPDDLRKLGLSERQAADFMEAAESHHGLIFVTGPTGSGKSTTLYTCLGLINTPDRNISTVEDPVEYKLEGLNQVQVNPLAGLTFAGALRAFLRQDPDVIMVGEVRDTETARICMRAAQTGHLVLSTLHTNTALQVVTRLIDMGIEPFLLGPSLRLLEAQRLVRRLCERCSTWTELPADAALRHGLEPGLAVRRPSEKGCQACRGRGYRGRLGIYEVVRVTEDIQEAIAGGMPMGDLERMVRAAGYAALAEDARAKVAQGLTSLEEVADFVQVD